MTALPHTILKTLKRESNNELCLALDWLIDIYIAVLSRERRRKGKWLIWRNIRNAGGGSWPTLDISMLVPCVYQGVVQDSISRTSILSTDLVRMFLHELRQSRTVRPSRLTSQLKARLTAPLLLHELWTLKIKCKCAEVRSGGSALIHKFRLWRHWLAKATCNSNALTNATRVKGIFVQIAHLRIKK